MHKLPNEYTLEEKVHGIIDNDLKITHSRSGGHGGQNVNKRETKAEGYINICETPFLTDEEKEKITNVYHKHVSKEGVLRVVEQEERYLEHNVEKLKSKIKNLLLEVLTPEKERFQTSPSLATLKQDHHNKKYNSKKKQERARNKHIDY